MKLKYIHFYPNGQRKQFNLFNIAIDNALKCVNKYQIIEIRPTYKHDAAPFGLNNKGSTYVIRSKGKTFVR